MQGYTRVMYAELCRLCATHRPVEKVNIYKEEGIRLRLHNKMQTLVNIKVSVDDHLPKVVCRNCLLKLEEAEKFWNTCQSAEITLNSFYSRAQNIDYFKSTGAVYVQNNDLNISENSDEMNYIIIGSNKTTKMMKVNSEKGVQPVQVKNQTTYPNLAQKQRQTKLRMEAETKIINDGETFIVQVYDSDPNNQSETSFEQELVDLDMSTNEANADVNTKPKDQSIVLERQYVCAECGKAFKRREHLYQHSKLHSGLRPFKCNHCPRDFRRKEHLLRHETLHTGQKDFTCDLCAKTFSRSDNLHKHRKTHEKAATTYTCDVCQKVFILKHYYDQHMQTAHTDQEPLKQSKIEILLKHENNDSGDGDEEVLIGNNLKARGS